MQRLLTCCAAALAIAAAAAVPMAAQSDRTEFESHQWYTAIPERGAINCPGGGEASPSLMPPWCGDGRTTVRDRVITGVIDQTTDARVSGTIRVTMNMNLDASFQGPAWGSYTIEVPGRGKWEGIWQGKSRNSGLATYRLVLHGSGEFEGLELRATGVWQYPLGESLSGDIIAAQ